MNRNTVLLLITTITNCLKGNHFKESILLVLDFREISLLKSNCWQNKFLTNGSQEEFSAPSRGRQGPLAYVLVPLSLLLLSLHPISLSVLPCDYIGPASIVQDHMISNPSPLTDAPELFLSHITCSQESGTKTWTSLENILLHKLTK